MRIGITIQYADGIGETVEQLGDYRDAGASLVLIPEAYTFDAVSQLGYVAAKVPDMEIASDIFALYTRTPSLLAMTAAGLDYVSGGRFTLGLGASGPQVVEGFHGVAYDAPLGRTRDIIDVCRQVWRRDRVELHTRHYDIPLTPARGGSGLGKALKLINHPVRERIPIMVAAMGPQNVELCAELAEGWAPFFYYPEHAEEVWGESLARGFAKRDESLGPLDVFVPVSVAVGPEVQPQLDHVRQHLALYVGGMGAKGKNFYHQLVSRYGYGEAADHVQELYLSGQKAEAAAAVPDDLARGVSFVGDIDFVRGRVEAMRAAGVTTFAATPLGDTHAERVRSIELLAGLL